MTPGDFGASLAILGYTQRGFANYTGANERTVRRWIAGELDIPGWVPRMLQLMLQAAPSGMFAFPAGATLIKMTCTGAGGGGTGSGE
jgi:hypothetical protein